MANYISAIRTNYFRVKDPDAFYEFMSRVQGWEEDPELWEKKNDDGTLRFGFGCYGDILGCYPEGFDPEEDDPDPDECYDLFLSELTEHVADDDAILIIEGGHEKLRYVVGRVTVITKDGVESINITDAGINLAREKLQNDNWQTDCNY